MTLFDAILKLLSHAARYGPGDVVAPAAVLWTGDDGQWRSVVEQLRPLMPELLTLDEHMERVVEPGRFELLVGGLTKRFEVR